jgi:hypothetical protein
VVEQGLAQRIVPKVNIFESNNVSLARVNDLDLGLNIDMVQSKGLPDLPTLHVNDV